MSMSDFMTFRFPGLVNSKIEEFIADEIVFVGIGVNDIKQRWITGSLIVNDDVSSGTCRFHSNRNERTCLTYPYFWNYFLSV